MEATTHRAMADIILADQARRIAVEVTGIGRLATSTGHIDKIDTGDHGVAGFTQPRSGGVFYTCYLMACDEGKYGLVVGLGSFARNGVR